MPRVSIVSRIALRAARFALLTSLAGATLGMLTDTSELKAQGSHGRHARVHHHAHGRVHHQPIVHGHRVQPRPSDFEDPEFTPEQSKRVDELYSELLRMRESESARAERIRKGARD
jgi:hypothetical protein